MWVLTVPSSTNSARVNSLVDRLFGHLAKGASPEHGHRRPDLSQHHLVADYVSEAGGLSSP